MFEQIRSLWPFFFVFGEAKRDEALHLLGDLALLGFAEHKGSLFNLLLNVPLILAGEVELFEEQFICNAAKRPHIYLRCVAFSIEYFRSHKRISTKYFSKRLFLGCKTEVAYLEDYLTFAVDCGFSDEDILWFEIPMTDIEAIEVL